jgi:hypothetical protein
VVVHQRDSRTPNVPTGVRQLCCLILVVQLQPQREAFPFGPGDLAQRPVNQPGTPDLSRGDPHAHVAKPDRRLGGIDPLAGGGGFRSGGGPFRPRGTGLAEILVKPRDHHFRRLLSGLGRSGGVGPLARIACRTPGLCRHDHCNPDSHQPDQQHSEHDHQNRLVLAAPAAASRSGRSLPGNSGGRGVSVGLDVEPGSRGRGRNRGIGYGSCRPGQGNLALLRLGRLCDRDRGRNGPCDGDRRWFNGGYRRRTQRGGLRRVRSGLFWLTRSPGHRVSGRKQPPHPSGLDPAAFLSPPYRIPG